MNCCSFLALRLMFSSVHILGIFVQTVNPSEVVRNIVSIDQAFLRGFVSATVLLCCPGSLSCLEPGSWLRHPNASKIDLPCACGASNRTKEKKAKP
eukprot:3413775-Amphidinium_carterae.1